MSAPRVGWCGIGQMGEAMVGNLLKAGHKVTIWNRSPEKCEPLRALAQELEGCVCAVANSPQEVFENSDIIIVMLSTPDVARAWWAENAQFAVGKIVADCATLGPPTMQYIAGLLQPLDVQFLEAPVAGHSGMAKAKVIEFLCAGSRSAFEALTPLFEAMGKNQIFLGEEVGKASKLKLIVNSTLGNMMAALAEAMTVTEKAGISQEQYLSIIGSHAMLSNGLFKNMGPRMMEDSHDPLFATKHEEKDLGLFLDLAGEVNQAAPIAAATRKLHKDALDDGQGEKHMSAIYNTLKKQTS